VCFSGKHQQESRRHRLRRTRGLTELPGMANYLFVVRSTADAPGADTHLGRFAAPRERGAWVKGNCSPQRRPKTRSTCFAALRANASASPRARSPGRAVQRTHLPAEVRLPPRVQARHDRLHEEGAPSPRVEQGGQQTREGGGGDGAVPFPQALEGHLRRQVLHHGQDVRPQPREPAQQLAVDLAGFPTRCTIKGRERDAPVA